MEDNLRKQVEDVVTAIFASKEKETIRQKSEDALNASADTIQELTSQIAAANEAAEIVATEGSELKAQIETLEADKVAAAEAYEAALKEITEAKEAIEADLEKVSLELSTMKSEITANTRMAELEAAGVVREDSAVQKAKVTPMTDEEFASYKEELESIKAQVVASLKVKEEAVDDDEDATTPPANIDKEQQAQAALNLESQPSQDLAAKYADLGKAMAEAIKNK